jgi:hypothetical protein
VPADGVFAFRWHPPAGTTSIRVPGLAPLAAWTSPGAAGRAVTSGPPASWHVTSTGARGYVVSGLAWQVRPDAYRATVRLATSGPVNVELWDDNGPGALLARRAVAATSGPVTLTIPVNATVPLQPAVYRGWGPFRSAFITPPRGQRVELRVWSPGRASMSVYGASLVKTKN